MAEFTRITFELPQEKSKELELLMDRAGLKSRKDLINTALTLLAWVIQEHENGRTVASLDHATKHYRKLQIIGLYVQEMSDSQAMTTSNSTDSQEGLEPCPLADRGKAEFTENRFFFGIGYGVKCNDCGLWLDSRARTRAEAAQLWNTRAAVAELRGEAAANTEEGGGNGTSK